MAIIEVELKTVAPRKWTGNFGQSAPTIDSSTGVAIGDIAVDSSAALYVWTCLDATVGAPVWQKTLTTTYITQNAAPAGTVNYFAMSSLPAGWLECNGAAVSRTTYAALFANISTTYGAGDGSSTFNLPDLRGYFLRGWDHGAGVDTGRNLGTTQADDFKGHYHLNGVGENDPVANVFVYTTVTTDCPGYATNYSVNTGAGATTHQGLTSTTTGTETRPKNVAMMTCIKY